jgi:sarcosine oxidase, subunit beta
MRTIQADVAIIGGGIIGVSAALFLQQKGQRAVVLERGMLASEASGRNGGGVRQQGRLLPEVPFAREAVALWWRLDDLIGRPTGYRRTGSLFVAESDDEMEGLAEQRSRETAHGLETELLDASQVRELSPGLSPHVVGGKLCPTDGHAPPAQAVVAIADAARDAGAELVCHTRVEQIGVAGGRVSYVTGGDVRVEAPVVLDAAGPWAPSVSQLVDAYLPIFPSRSHQMLTPPLEYLAGPFTITARWDFGVVQGDDGRMQFGGGSDSGDPGRFTFSKRFVEEKGQGIHARAGQVFPALERVPIEARWVGSRECTPDMMPILGPVAETAGFFVCSGFSGHGFCLGPYAGQLMAEWIVDGRPSFDLSAFQYQRFQRPEGPLAVVTAAGAA